MLNRRTMMIGISTCVAMTTLPVRRGEGRSKDLYGLLSGSGEFASWGKLVAGVGLISLLEGSAFLTMFAPTNDAFAAAPDFLKRAADGKITPETAMQVGQLVKAHIVMGRHDLSEIGAGAHDYTNLAAGTLSSTSTRGQNITVRWESATTFGEAAITASPIEASNGLLYPLSHIFAVRTQP